MRILAFLGLIGLSVYHTLIIVGLLSSDYVWGGHIDDISKKIILESIALVITTSLIYLTYQIIYNKPINYYHKVGILFGMTIFAFSFIGNLFSLNHIEKYVCSTISLFYVYFFYTEFRTLSFIKLLK